MGVAGEIGEHRLGPGEGRLGVDEPLLPPEWREARGECLLATRTLDLAEERQPTGRVGVGEPGQEEPPGTDGTTRAPVRGSRVGMAPSACRPARARRPARDRGVAAGVGYSSGNPALRKAAAYRSRSLSRAYATWP
jgi:hypothetical protein